MENELIDLIKESSMLERNVAKVYRLISEEFPEDRSFWWLLAMEEENHSSIYDSFAEGDLSLNKFPEEIIDKDLESIKKANSKIESDLKELFKKQLSKREFYEYALDIESMSSENIFQEAMKIENPSTFLKLVQSINADDVKHKEKIKELLDKIES